MRNTITICTLINGLGINQDRRVIDRDTQRFATLAAFLHAAAKAATKVKHVVMRHVMPSVAVAVRGLCTCQSSAAPSRSWGWSWGSASEALGVA